MPDDGFKSKDAASYDAVTEAYDKYIERFSPPLVARAIELAEFEVSDRVLDIGTGTGIVAIEAAKRLGPEGSVVGIDLSDGMLAMARDKAEAAGVAGRVAFEKDDAEALTAKDGSFDAAVSLFALLHFPNPERALAEFFRVLRPGGRLVMAVGSGPSWLTPKGLAHGSVRVLQLLKERMGKRLSALRFMHEMLDRYLPEHEEVEETGLVRAHKNRARVVPRLFQEAGFSDVRAHWHGFEARIDSIEEFWELQATFSSTARKRLPASPPERVQELKEKFFERCQAVKDRGGELAYTYAGLFVVGRRPKA